MAGLYEGGNEPRGSLEAVSIITARHVCVLPFGLWERDCRSNQLHHCEDDLYNARHVSQQWGGSPTTTGARQGHTWRHVALTAETEFKQWLSLRAFYVVLSRLRRLPADPQMRSGAGSIPAWTDYLVGFFRGFPNRNQLSEFHPVHDGSTTQKITAAIESRDAS
ncbi:hypothetical protein ANN_06247 [Periplaneta americana]|uniref:Uncharacterized protein n=1 Tax=Periplaneta americana TaxID=6978 RepID=A0ABQ8TF22_PERAM|nr:hypothetical protein ANN_06247 [Periplaneta americana]